MVPCPVLSMFLTHGAFLLLSLPLEEVLEPSACRVANCYELPDILYEAPGISMVFSVVVEVVGMCFLGRDDN